MPRTTSEIWKSGDIADDIRFRHSASNHPAEVAPFVETGGVVAHVVRLFVAGRVLECFVLVPLRRFNIGSM